MTKRFWDVASLTKELVQFPSVTPKDEGVQGRLAEWLSSLGFTVYPLPFGDIRNFYARIGTRSPLFCFAGHTDVVPPGPDEEWSSPPFSGEVRNGQLYGRGAADMKGAIAAMVSAVAPLVQEGRLTKRGSMAFLITGDEEGAAVNGTLKVLDWLREKGEKIDFCLVGEPTSETRIGDTLKTGRRGSINGRLTLFGTQGHVAYPDLAKNPLQESLPLLQKLASLQLDQGNESFQPSRLVLTNVNGGTGRDNVIPDRVEIRFNIRHGTASNNESIRKKIEALLESSGLRYTLALESSGPAFLTGRGKLVDALVESVEKVQGYRPAESTTGGTSDARFIAPAGIETVELGLKNETIHKINECVPVADLEALAGIYRSLLENILQ
ncbi:MAG TPA: succinyl-diaminopimelate desuccinylase [Nitrospiria bacterium]|nr:succinyl-diaminopimelate desuccinylase [Nitrospiria bacterium]